MKTEEEYYNELAEVWSTDPDGGYIDHEEIDPELFEELRRMYQEENDERN